MNHIPPQWPRLFESVNRATNDFYLTGGSLLGAIRHELGQDWQPSALATEDGYSEAKHAAMRYAGMRYV